LELQSNANSNSCKSCNCNECFWTLHSNTYAPRAIVRRVCGAVNKASNTRNLVCIADLMRGVSLILPNGSKRNKVLQRNPSNLKKNCTKRLKCQAKSNYWNVLPDRGGTSRQSIAKYTHHLKTQTLGN
jgi:hypothetical protein